MELGILSLSDRQADPANGLFHDAGSRVREIVSYGIAADQAGLDVFALGEHHSAEFAVSSPAVVLAAIAQATGSIRLTSAVSVLSTLDPVRLHQDFATLDLISQGRAEIIAGRSAFLEAFELFGIDKILLEREILGIDRFIGQIDLGGLPPAWSTGLSSCWPPKSPPPSARRPLPRQ